jgi:hypothetical protein
MFHWNGAILHVTITNHVYINYLIMRIVGYIAAPNAVVFDCLDHTMRYLFFFRHMPIMYPRFP